MNLDEFIAATAIFLLAGTVFSCRRWKDEGKAPRQREEAETELRRYKNHLEAFVEERTSALNVVNGRLSGEVEERRETEAAREKLIVDLRDALAQIKTLKGFIPNIEAVSAADITIFVDRL